MINNYILKSAALILIALAAVSSKIYAQDTCKSISLDLFFKNVKSIDVSIKRELTYKKYKDFNFKDFKPIEGKIDSDYFEVGYTKKGVIAEINHYELKKRLFNYKLLIYDFDTHRIILSKRSSGKINEFSWLPIAMLLMKASNENYMVNFMPQFGSSFIYNSAIVITNFDFLSDLDDISCIMSLDENWYPTSMLKYSKGQVVMSSRFEYETHKPHVIKYESSEFFLSPVYNSKLSLIAGGCFFLQFFNVRSGELNLKLHPEMHGYDTAPLWIFGGAHDYQLQ